MCRCASSHRRLGKVLRRRSPRAHSVGTLHHFGNPSLDERPRPERTSTRMEHGENPWRNCMCPERTSSGSTLTLQATANLIPESVEWMNTFLGVMWGLIDPDMFASVADTLEDGRCSPISFIHLPPVWGRLWPLPST